MIGAWCNKFPKKQCIILWLVDNLNMVSVDSIIFSRVFSSVDAEYGNITKMTITRGKIHKCLGVSINLFLPVKINLSMVTYIGKILEYTPEDTRGDSMILASRHFLILTKMQPNCPKLMHTLFIILLCSYCTCQFKISKTSSWQFYYYSLEWESLMLITTIICKD